MGIYDDYHTQDAILKLKNSRTNRHNVEIHLLERLSFMALSCESLSVSYLNVMCSLDEDHGARRISEITDDLVAMLSENDDNIKAASMSCLLQLAKHQYTSWILRDDAKKKLEELLYEVARKTRVASLQCLSQLVAISKDTGNIEPVHQAQV
ncbi:hypothetical protein IW262DRAFT_337837 [Armillaria fumosa]|nr:hypothetical protein IW262DRAFT_337837 [Armillaria fumosa]